MLKKKLSAGQPFRGATVYGSSFAVEVLGAVHVAEVAHVFVVLGVAGEGEGVVAADGVADDLDERHLVLVEELPVQARLRIGVPNSDRVVVESRPRSKPDPGASPRGRQGSPSTGGP